MRDFTNQSFSGVKFSFGCLLGNDVHNAFSEGHNVFLENVGLTYSISSRIGNYEELFAMGSNDPICY